MTRVSDLAGGLLAYWVAKAIKLHITCDTYQGEDSDSAWPAEAEGEPMFEFEPHTDWQQGGELIEEHEIEIAVSRAAGEEKGWCAMMFNNECDLHPLVHQTGPTPLIAAMRALVSSVYGDSVPDEVTP